MTLRAFIQAERPRIEQIVRDETWLAGERLHRPVDPHEPVVQERVAEIILTIAGARMRAAIDPELTAC